MEKKQKIVRTAAYYLSYITIGFATGIIGPTLPGLSKLAGTNLVGISYIFPILSIGYLIGSYAGGRMYDTYKVHPVTAGAIVLLGIVMFFVPFSQALWIILALFFITGLAAGSIDVGGNALLVWTHGSKVGPFMVGLHFFYGFGAFIAPMIVGLSMRVSPEIGWPYWILTIICIPIMLFIFLIPSTKAPSVVSTQAASKSSRLLVLLIAIFMFMHVGAELSYGGWIYSYALKLGITNETNAAYLTSAYWGAIMVGRLISVAVSLKVRPKVMLFVYLIGCVLSALFLITFSTSLAAVWICTITLGLSVSTLVPTTFTLTGDNLHISGKLAGWLVIGIGAGNLVVPWLIGQLFEPVGAIILPIINLITFIFALGLLTLIILLIKKMQLEKV
ncbi:MAG: MFS transporter [Bacteroidetes bacterium]|nr:MFS transporter [Bacteroidota bacterium]